MREVGLDRFRAIVVEKTEAGQGAPVLTRVGYDDLMAGDVTIRVTHSTINYKDGLALTGKAPVIRRFPMIPGIDLAGIVETSEHPEFKAGESVLLNGWGTGETHLGAFAERSRVKGEWLVALPEGLSAADAMAIGTAGYTAMLAVMAIEAHGVRPQDGSALVTGAAGGVGSVAVSLMSGAGWHVVASTGRPEEGAYLKQLGATEIVARAELTEKPRALAKERWAAAIDSVGSTTLANVLSMTRYGGAVAACGLAGGMDLPGSVAPFILRGVALLGIDSVMAPKALRVRAWERLARDLDRAKLAAMTRTIGLDDVIAAGHEIMAGRVRGRIVVEIG